MSNYPTVCPNSKDGMGHCVCWWDEEPCCWCGSDEWEAQIVSTLGES